MAVEQFEGSIYYPPSEAAELAANTVNAFQHELEIVRLTPPHIVVIEEAITHARQSSGKTLTQSCVEFVEKIVASDVNTRWYVDSKETAQVMHGLRKTMISRTSIGETSAHQVFFARLSGDHHGVRVAVKPFEFEPNKAIREWVNMKLAETMGLHVFRPLGFMVAGKGYSITERRDGIELLDNADWTQVLTQADKNQSLLDDLRKIGPALARVHHKGCYHGDPQAKNMVITQSGSVNLIDWEAATFRRSDAETLMDAAQEPGIRRMAGHDLRVLFGSLARSVGDHGVGFLTGLTPPSQYSYFRELIIDPYIEERMRLIGEQDNIESIESSLAHLGEIEREVAHYVLTNSLQNSLSRSR